MGIKQKQKRTKNIKKKEKSEGEKRKRGHMWYSRNINKYTKIRRIITQ
jgi:hypothetical protein